MIVERRASIVCGEGSRAGRDTKAITKASILYIILMWILIGIVITLMTGGYNEYDNNSCNDTIELRIYVGSFNKEEKAIHAGFKERKNERYIERKSGPAPLDPPRSSAETRDPKQPVETTLYHTNGGLSGDLLAAEGKEG